MEIKKNYIFGIVLFLVVVILGITLFTQEANNSPAEKCLVTILGREYDVTKFKKSHEGGDVFVCGTDMTVEFQKQHGNDTARIERELGL